MAQCGSHILFGIIFSKPKVIKKEFSSLFEFWKSVIGSKHKSTATLLSSLNSLTLWNNFSAALLKSLKNSSISNRHQYFSIPPLPLPLPQNFDM